MHLNAVSQSLSNRDFVQIETYLDHSSIRLHRSARRLPLKASEALPAFNPIVNDRVSLRTRLDHAKLDEICQPLLSQNPWTLVVDPTVVVYVLLGRLQ